MDQKLSFFDFAAEVGLTKHLGGIEATDTLINLCRIDRSKYVLDVGCGAGATPCYISKKCGCKVVGVDILERMIDRSRERTKKEKLSEQIEFRTADAQNLPFADNIFDAVITESVTVFPEDKQKAVSEYVRVTKPGGYIGLNESTWLKTPVPPEMQAWASQQIGAAVKPLTQTEWSLLLVNAGLQDIITKISEINLQVESKGILKRYGLGGSIGILFRMLLLFAGSSEYRNFVKKVQMEGITPQNLDEYFGYGLYVGRKRA